MARSKKSKYKQKLALRDAGLEKVAQASRNNSGANRQGIPDDIAGDFSRRMEKQDARIMRQAAKAHDGAAPVDPARKVTEVIRASDAAREERMRKSRASFSPSWW